MKIYIACSVGAMDDEGRQAMVDYAELMREQGHMVTLPFADMDMPESPLAQAELLRKAIEASDVIHLFYWTGAEARGLHFELGVAYALKKPLVIVDGGTPAADDLLATMLTEWQESTKTRLMTKQELVRYSAERLRKKILSREVADDDRRQTAD